MLSIVQNVSWFLYTICTHNVIDTGRLVQVYDGKGWTTKQNNDAKHKLINNTKTFN